MHYIGLTILHIYDLSSGGGSNINVGLQIVNTVRPRVARPQATRALQMHVF